MPGLTKLVVVAAIAACSRAPVAGAGGPASAPQAASDPGRPPYTAADVHFMSGMIVHHAQAVVLGGWAADAVHGASPELRALAARIIVAQTDEIAIMERWLRERHEPRMDHATLMPGMLTAEQLARLDAARAAAFDRLFLTLMIQHHQGAITMVEQLLGTPGAAQDGLVFRFAADVHTDQTTEIKRMRGMLAALFTGERTP